MRWQGAENKACWESNFFNRVEKMRKASGENLHVDNRAEGVQPDLIVDLHYNSTVIWR